MCHLHLYVSTFEKRSQNKTGGKNNYEKKIHNHCNGASACYCFSGLWSYP